MSWKSTTYFMPENRQGGKNMYEIVYDYTDLSGFEMEEAEKIVQK